MLIKQAQHYQTQPMSCTITLAILLVILGSILSILLQHAARIQRRDGRKLPPGPRPLPIIGSLHLLTALPHRGLQNLARKYGPIMSMRLGHVPTIVISSPHFAELFLKTYDNVFASRPKIQASVYMSYGTKGMAFTEYGPYWRNVRKLCTLQLLTPSKIESFAALRREEVVALVAWLRKAAAAGEVVDVSRKVGELIADMACRMILGRRMGDDRYDLKGIVNEVMRLSGAFNISDFIPFLAPFDLQGYTRRMKKVSKDMDEVFEKIISEHELVGRWQQGQEHHEDFIDVLLSLMNETMNPQGEHVYIIDRTNIKAILVDLITATIDTSSASIEWTLSLLLNNPRVMKNLQEELKNVIGIDKMVEEKDLGKLVYLDMVVKESFRLHPAIPLLLPHESMEDMTIEGYFIPKKSRIIVNTLAIGRDPNIWSENVEEFYPERFIKSNIDLRGRDFLLLPFGFGRRGCPGMQLGLTTVRLVLAQLLHCFSWELPSGVNGTTVDMTEKFGLSVLRTNHLLLKPTYRLLVEETI